MGGHEQTIFRSDDDGRFLGPKDKKKTEKIKKHQHKITCLGFILFV